MSEGALRTLRDRQEAANGDLDNSGDGQPDCAAAEFVLTTTVTTYPTTAAAFYACNPCQLNGLEAEGGTATPVPDTTTVFYALNQGTQIPPNGTSLVMHGVGGRWVFRYDG